MDNINVAVRGHPRTAAPQQNARSRPGPEVVPKAQRRRFSASYKLKVLEEVDNDSSHLGEGLFRTT